MSLRLQAAADAKAIVENLDDFGWPVTIVSPAGQTAALTGFSTDIGLTIDPETGQPVSGSHASVVLVVESLTNAGLGLPRGVAGPTERPWVVRFDDIHGTQQSFKVARTMVDRAVGLVTCIVEALREAP